MRLLIVGTLHGQLTLATKLAMDKGATVTHADGADKAMRVLRSGRSADLLLVEVAVDIRDLVTRLEAEHICVPIVRMRHRHRRARRGRGDPRRRERIHSAAARSGADRGRARGGGRRSS